MKKNTALTVLLVVLIVNCAISLFTCAIYGIQLFDIGKNYPAFKDIFLKIGIAIIINTLIVVAINLIIFFALSEMDSSISELYKKMQPLNQVESSISNTKENKKNITPTPSNISTYIITKECKLCSTCKTLCPTKAISLDSNTYKIDQKKCLQCGTCKENCPYDAILGL